MSRVRNKYFIGGHHISLIHYGGLLSSFYYACAFRCYIVSCVSLHYIVCIVNIISNRYWFVCCLYGVVLCFPFCLSLCSCAVLYIGYVCAFYFFVRSFAGCHLLVDYGLLVGVRLSLFTVRVIIRIIYYSISPICNCLCVLRCLICINPIILFLPSPIL